MRRPIRIAVALVVGVLLLAVIVGPVLAGKPGFSPNYEARFQGSLTNTAADILPQQRYVQVESNAVHTNMLYNDYPLDFGADFAAYAGRHMGYLSIVTDRSTGVTTFRYTYGKESDGYFYQLKGTGILTFQKGKGNQPFQFASTGAYTITRLGQVDLLVWTSASPDFGFSITGTPLP